MTSEKSTADLIQRTLSQAFEVLRGEFGIFLTGTDFHLVTVLLHLHQECALDGLAKTDPKWARQELFGRMYELTRGEPSREIYSAFKSTIDRVSESAFHRLMDIFNSLPPSATKGSYTAWVETCVESVAQFGGKAFGEHLQPKELTRLIIGLADLPADASIYNPFGGAASFGILLRDGDNYEGEEINAQIAAVGLIRLMASPRRGYYSFGQNDSIQRMNAVGHKHDLVVSNMPFNLRVKDEVPGFGSTLGVESFFFIRAVECLKASGKAIAVVPNGFLFGTRQDQKHVKEWLLRDDLLDTVISFPSGLLTHTGIPFSVVVIDLAKKRPDQIRFVQGDAFVKLVGKRERRLDDQLLLTELQSGSDIGVVRWVESSEVQANDNNLSPARYFTDKESIGNTLLGDILKSNPVERAGPGLSGRLVRGRDLKVDSLDYQMKHEAFVSEDIPPGDKRLDRSALILALRGSNLKPTWFDYGGQPIYLTNDLVPFDVDVSKVDVQYLVNELLSGRVARQVGSLNRGVSIQSLRPKDILSIRIDLPPIEEQRAKMKGVREAFVAAQVHEARRAAEQHGVDLDRFGNTASFKHLLGTPLANLGSGVASMSFALDAQYPGWRAHLISVSEKMTMGELIEFMTYELQRISALLETDSHDLEVENYPLEPMDLLTYAKAKVRMVQLDLKDGHNVTLLVDDDVRNELKGKLPIYGNKALLDIAMDAIVDNAKRHAFSRERGLHALQFRVGMSIEDSRTFLTLTVANSGKSFPDGFGVESYVRKNNHAGITGHTGIGGYHVNEVMLWHKGKLDLITDPKYLGPLSSAIELTFPLNEEN